jgi:SAM-dependent methyltransferase
MLTSKNRDWYKYGWNLGIKNQSWTEDTENQVNFIIKTLELQGNERILDLACGYGRHSLSLARRGFSVIGIDITKEYIDDANMNAEKENLNAKFFNSDIRDVSYVNEFDVVLNLADGAIGYLENDAENLKIFDVAARALKPGGKHFIDICNAEHARMYFPKTNWEAGEKSLALAEFNWDEETHTMLFGGWDIPYGQPFQKPAIQQGDPTRLYSKDELKEIYAERNMQIVAAFSNYYGKPDTPKEIQLLVYAKKDV